jgi:antitoxin ParD1/3/4
MSLNIPPEFERAVLERVQSGAYPSTDAVLTALVEALAREESDEAERFEALRREVQIGLDQIKRGQVMDGREALERIRERIKQRAVR